MSPARRVVHYTAYQPIEDGHEERTGTPPKVLAYALTKPRAVEGCVTLTQLASERGIQAQLARLWVKRAGIRRSREGWRWMEGSKALKRVRKVLGLS